MTHEEFISLVKQPETVNAQHVTDLKEMVERYPYFVPARLFFVKALQQSKSIFYADNFKIASLHSPSRRWFYYYLYPEKMLSNEPYHRERTVKSSGNYFDMINVVESEGGDTKQSLKNLAERLKSARAMVVNLPVNSVKKITVVKENEAINAVKEINEIEESIDTIVLNNINEIKIEKYVSEDYFSSIEHEISEINAKKLILERKYKDAIEILRQLNLNNPKKSVYFADQIRFLEKVIENSKK